jgi:hypothetical protein
MSYRCCEASANLSSSATDLQQCHIVRIACVTSERSGIVCVCASAGFPFFSPVLAMKIRSINPCASSPGLAALVLLAAAPSAFAQTDEIQVYDAEIAEKGVFNLMIHSNYTPIGRKTPDFPGAIIANQSENGAAEWAYGVASWFEQGLYLPVYSLHSENHGTTVNGFKIRELFVRPHAAEHTFFYGVNFEFSVNKLYWEPKRISSEIRPIVGVHLHPIDLIVNPIMDTDYTGGFRGLQFNPAARIAYNLPRQWAVAVEWYSGFGRFRDFEPTHDQFHEVWAVVDHNTKFVNIETGVGVGVTAGSDRLTFKLMLSRDLNTRTNN